MVAAAGVVARALEEGLGTPAAVALAALEGLLLRLPLACYRLSLNLPQVLLCLGELQAASLLPHLAVQVQVQVEVVLVVVWAPHLLTTTILTIATCQRPLTWL
jgi:hypothetical protein